MYVLLIPHDFHLKSIFFPQFWSPIYKDSIVNMLREESAQSVIWSQINESLIPISPRSVSRDAAPGQVLPWATITLGATVITGRGAR